MERSSVVINRICRAYQFKDMRKEKGTNSIQNTYCVYKPPDAAADSIDLRSNCYSSHQHRHCTLCDALDGNCYLLSVTALLTGFNTHFNSSVSMYALSVTMQLSDFLYFLVFPFKIGYTANIFPLWKPVWNSTNPSYCQPFHIWECTHCNRSSIYCTYYQIYLRNQMICYIWIQKVERRVPNKKITLRDQRAQIVVKCHHIQHGEYIGSVSAIVCFEPGVSLQISWPTTTTTGRWDIEASTRLEYKYNRTLRIQNIHIHSRSLFMYNRRTERYSFIYSDILKKRKILSSLILSLDFFFDTISTTCFQQKLFPLRSTWLQSYIILFNFYLM